MVSPHSDEPDALGDSDLQAFCDRLDRLETTHSECFLCANSIASGRYTLEHVIPAWAQRRYNLWNQQLDLLNETSISYRQLTVPCCDECNSTHLKSIEDSLAQTVEQGREAVEALPKRTLFLWLGKIFYGILYKELSLLLDRSDPNGRPIITADFFRRFRMHRFFLQQARERIRLLDFEPGSVFVWGAQPLANKEQEWDLVDNVDTMFIACRVGRVALFAALADGGAQECLEDEDADIRGLLLHPLQFRELAAQFAYRSRLATRTPKYIMMQGNPHQVTQLPLGGFSLMPLFRNVDARTYAAYLACYTGLPIERLYDAPNRVWTCLRTPSGTPNFMSVQAYPP